MRKAEIAAALSKEGFVVTEWTDPPHTRYATHTHHHREVRVVLHGEMTFVSGSIERTLRAGDRIEFEPGQEHAATVGAEGATYLAGTQAP